MTPSQPLLQLEGISKHFGPVQALDRVDFAVSAGEVVSGEISIAPNTRNPRDLDIMVNYKHNGVAGSSSATLRFKMS